MEPAFLPDPAQGRLFTAARPVRSTDVTPDGRLRLDALARYLAEAAEDDVDAAGWDAPYDWLLRRCAVAVHRYPHRGERISLRTFCSATGPRWAERTTTLAGPDGDLIQARAVWVAISRADASPCPLGAEFHRVYGPSTQGRRATARLSHPRPPQDQPSRPWPLRAADFDPAGHVNNTVHWAAAEDVLARQAPSDAAGPTLAELEYHRPMLPGDQPCLATSRDKDRVWLWLLDGQDRLASALLVFG